MTHSLRDALKDCAELQALIAAAESRPDAKFEDFLPQFRALGASDLGAIVADGCLRNLREQPSFLPPKFVIAGQVHGTTLYDCKHFAVAVGFRSSLHGMKASALTTAGTRIVVNGFDHFAAVMHQRGEGTWSLYDVPSFDDSNPLAPDSRLQLAGRGAMAQGQDFFLRSGRQAFVIDAFEGESIYLDIVGGVTRFHSTPIFDSNTLQLVGMSAGDRISSRIELLTKALACLEHRPGLGVLETLSDHSHHFIRWNSIRHAMCIDPEFGFRLARRATDDPHPHVRAAARQTVALFADKFEEKTDAVAN